MSARLQVPMAELMRWIRGEKKPSPGVFLRIVDFILEESRRSPPLQGGRKSSGKRAV